MKKVFGNKKAIIIFMTPAVIMYTLFVIYPIIMSIYYSLLDGTPNVNAIFIGIDNYTRLIGNDDFINSLRVTMQYMIFVAGGWIIFGLLVALLLNYGVRKYSHILRTIIYMPVVIPGVGAAAMFSKIFEMEPHYGLLNSLLNRVGLEAWIQPWAGQSSTVMWTVISADMWRGMGYYAIIFFAGLINIPKELEEAAKIDGANFFQLMRRVVLPLLRPVTIMACVLAVNNALRVYDLPRVLTNGGPGRASQTLSLLMTNEAFTRWNFGYGSTIAVVILILTIICTQTIVKLDKKEVTQ